MIVDANEMEDHINYRINKDKIEYVHRDQYTDKIVCGYKTQFAYLRELDNGKVSEAAFNNNSGLRLTCGNFSYAKITDVFDVIMGVTGTLKSVSQTQREIIVKDFKIHHETYMPSVFGQRNLEFDPVKHVYVVQSDKFFQSIVDQIKQGLKGSGEFQRAVLVVFEDQIALKEFLKSQ